VQLQAEDPSRYLGSDDVVDHEHPDVRALARRLRSGRPDDVDFARAAFQHVRDEIAHSWDAQDPRVTLRASEVLAEGVGLCYAKSHLLAALLRAEGIPAGLCYQLLTDDGATFMLHGLVAVHLEGAWHRQDPRGNKPGVDAQFTLDGERLAWPVRGELGEVDHPELLVAAAPSVVAALERADDLPTLYRTGLPSALV
jgi:transglutaminase-like putative cysteine protease